MLPVEAISAITPNRARSRALRIANCAGKAFTFESRRGEKMLERYGFKVLNRAEITKYKAFYPQSVYLSTVIKNLETAEPLSVTSRPR